MFRPESDLPYEKEDIRKAMQALLDFTLGLKSSEQLDADMRTREFAENLGGCILQLDWFLPVPAEELPTQRHANSVFGFAYRDTKSLEKAREAAQLFIERRQIIERRQRANRSGQG